MCTIDREYGNLEHALDDIRATLTEWADAQAEADPRAEAMRHARVVLQEWLANLFEHAHFADRSPSVTIRVRAVNQGVHGVVLDNSDGFDLDTELSPSKKPVDPLPDRGMGLRIMDACTTSLSYVQQEDGLYRLEFSIPADHDPWLNTPF
ncbi:MAG: ATP-binding protein [Salinivenus sp.]